MRRRTATLFKQLERFTLWSMRADVRPLGEGEEILIEGLAGFMQSIWPRSGWLRLTNRRLIYMPAKPRYIPLMFSRLPVVELDVGDIVGLGKRRWLRSLWGQWPGVPPFVVEMRDGTTYTFQALPPGLWRREIAKAAGLPADGA